MNQALLRIAASGCVLAAIGCGSDAQPSDSVVGPATENPEAGQAQQNENPVASVNPAPRDASVVVQARDGGDSASPEDANAGSGCVAGAMTAGQGCSCDLGGTFAFRGQLELAFSGQPGTEDGRATSELWASVVSKYDAQGKLELSLTECGQSLPDLCGTGLPPLVGAEAYGQYAAAQAWEKGTAPATTISIDLTAAVPNAPFVSPPFALLSGITLTDPLGPWPTGRKDVEGGAGFDGSAVNGARWVDVDDDGAVGITLFAVPPGGVVADGSATAPDTSYGATSRECPRADPQAPRSSYGNLPVVDGLTLVRIKRLHEALRITAAFNGALESCDRISGALGGPNSGKLQVETRLGGCAIADGSGEKACGAGLLDLAERTDAFGVGSALQSAKFVMKRVAAGTTCSQVRAIKFD